MTYQTTKTLFVRKTVVVPVHITLVTEAWEDTTVVAEALNSALDFLGQGKDHAYGIEVAQTEGWEGYDCYFPGSEIRLDDPDEELSVVALHNKKLTELPR